MGCIVPFMPLHHIPDVSGLSTPDALDKLRHSINTNIGSADRVIWRILCYDGVETCMPVFVVSNAMAIARYINWWCYDMPYIYMKFCMSSRSDGYACCLMPNFDVIPSHACIETETDEDWHIACPIRYVGKNEDAPIIKDSRMPVGIIDSAIVPRSGKFNLDEMIVLHDIEFGHDDGYLANLLNGTHIHDCEAKA